MALQVQVREHVMVATLDRPQARNAVDSDTSIALEAVLDQVEGDHSLRVGVLAARTTGQRPVFCAGADLREVASGRGHLIPTERGGFGGFVFRQRRKPWIAAVDGLALGGGFELVLACDLVVASTRSSFGLPEVQRGLVAGAGGMQRLPLALPPAVAMEALLTGRPIPSQRLQDCGFLAAHVEPDDVLPRALELAEAVASAAPLAVQASLAVARSARWGDQARLREMAAREEALVARSADVREGVAAFLEKRNPMWQGR